ncbi:MAG: ABC transporter permease [Cyclobacteriaceae bacterium]|nr:ABC transporter permease [Cyclobacteriaceae bacterium]
MLSNYLKVAVRSLLRFKSYTLINLLGLALGLMAGVLILVFVLDELSFDQFHAKRDRIYRVNTAFFTEGSEPEGANDTNGWPIGKILEKDYPEVEAVLYARFSGLHINQEDKRFRERSFFASEQLFDIFSFELLKGNPKTALKEPYSVVISEALAAKLFPGQDPFGKTLLMADTLNMLVTGIMKNIPSQSHIQAEMFLSFSTYETLVPEFSYDEGWGNINMRNYILLREGADFQSFAAKSKNIYNERAGEMLKNWGVQSYVLYDALPDIYLRAKTGNGMGPKGSIDRLYLLSGIAFFVIVLACINFINLATARSVFRAKEVGLRKVVGSTRSSLIGQFLSESFVLTALAMVMALALVGLLLPTFNQLLGKSYELSALTQGNVLMGLLLLLVGITVLAGYYPAWVLSGLRPSQVLAGRMQTGQRGTGIRRFLVVFQFFVSVCLVTGTLVVIDQINFMQNQDLGFNREQVLVINSVRVNLEDQQPKETFRNQVADLAMVNRVSRTMQVPGISGWQGQIAYPEGKSGDEAVSVEYMGVDENYVDVLGLEIIAGRSFSKDHPDELHNGLILNEAAVAVFGWSSPEEAIGKQITSPSKQPEGTVIGVIRDYHHEGLQQKIGPITLDYNPGYLFAIRYQASDTRALLASLEEMWTRSFPGYEFNYFFLDDQFEKEYQSEQRLASVLGMFSILTIVIAVIGMIGLVSFLVISKTKEIGVRKVLGASVFSISTLLTREFVTLVLVAGLLASPLTWYLASGWLESFAYRTSLNPLLFLVSTVTAVMVALVAVSVQTLRAAMADPVNSLRYE